MRWVILGVVFAFLLGCARNPEGASHGDTFDANNYASTVEWLHKKTFQLEQVQRRENQLAYQSTWKDLNSELASHKGKVVSWKIPVKSVGDGKLAFQLCLVSSSNVKPKVWFVVTGTSHAAPKESEVLRGYDGPQFGVLPIGDVLNEAEAAKYGKGDKIHVTGKIVRFDLDGYSDELFFNVVLVNASVKN